MADASFLDRLDGVLIAMAPTSATFEEDQYEKVYGQAVPAIVEALRQRQVRRPLHVTYLSSAGVYGDQAGAICNELTPPDCSNKANTLLVSAETSVLSLNDASTQACVLRLGGIYGPGKDIPSYIRSAAGQPVRKNGKKLFRLRLIVKIETGGCSHREIDPGFHFWAAGCHHKVVAGLKV